MDATLKIKVFNKGAEKEVKFKCVCVFIPTPLG